MNKIYILSALLLASTEAGKLANDPINASTLSNVLWGSYTYTLTGDCLSSVSPTTLGMNNVYYQYY